MMSFLEKLLSRKTEIARKNLGVWAQLVVDVADGKEIDSDVILSELDRLHRTPGDLQAGVELLLQRRAWSAIAKAGDDAEAAYPGLTKQVADAETSLKDLIEKHHAKFAPLEGRIHAARESISSGADAKRRLLDTCSTEAESAATEGIDLRITETQAAKADVVRRLRDCETWVLDAEGRGDSAATTDMAKLPAMREKLTGLEAELKAFNSQLGKLQDERGKASESLLRPEMI